MLNCSGVGYLSAKQQPERTRFSSNSLCTDSRSELIEEDPTEFNRNQSLNLITSVKTARSENREE